MFCFKYSGLSCFCWDGFWIIMLLKVLSHFHLRIYLDYYWIYMYLCEGPLSVCCHVTSSIQQAFLYIGACEYHNILMHWLHQPILNHRNHFTVCMTLKLIARGRPKIFFGTKILCTLEPAMKHSQWPRSEFNVIWKWTWCNQFFVFFATNNFSPGHPLMSGLSLLIDKIEGANHCKCGFIDRIGLSCY